MSPEIVATGNAFKVMLPCTNTPDASSVNAAVQDAPKAILDHLAKHGSITRIEVEALCEMTTATANRTLKRMLEDKLIAVTGKGKNTKYVRL